MMTSDPVTECVASGEHDAIKADPARWASLPSIGELKDRHGRVSVLKNCARCKSTLALKLEAQS